MCVHGWLCTFVRVFGDHRAVIFINNDLIPVPPAVQEGDNEQGKDTKQGNQVKENDKNE